MIQKPSSFMSFKENSKTLTDLTLQFQCEELRKQLEKFDEYGNISSEAFLNESRARKEAESELEKVCIQIPETDELEMTHFSKTSKLFETGKREAEREREGVHKPEQKLAMCREAVHGRD